MSVASFGSDRGGTPNRFQTLNLGSAGPSTIPNLARHRPERGGAALRTDDIAGARPELKHLRYVDNRPNLYQTGDLPKAAPARLHQPLRNASDNTLRTNDIEGAQPHPYTFKTNRVVDPLEPAYPLPSSVPAEAVVPKFIRDGYSVSDIEGTRPRPRFRYAVRDSISVSNIEGAKAGWRPRHERARREAEPTNAMFDVRDINDTGFKTKRVSDPLRPVHFVNGMEISDDLVHTMPKKLPAGKNEPYYTLTTADIEGAQCGWKPPHDCQPPMEKRRHFRNTNFVGDIAGAQSDTVKHSIRTNRHTNPLNPRYLSLDGDSLGPPKTPLYALPPSTADHQQAQQRETMPGSPQVLNQSQQQQQQQQMMMPAAQQQQQQFVPPTSRDGRPPMPPGMAPRMDGREGSAARRTATDIGAAAPSSRGRSGSGSRGGADGSGDIMIRSSPRVDTQRLILRSSDGNPRVVMSPAERRQASARKEEIDSVRGL